MCMQSPKPPDAIDNQREILSTQIKQAPRVFAANQEWSPQYNQLQLGNLSEFLTGSRNTTGGVGGIYSTLFPKFTALGNDANTATRTATVNDAYSLAPQLNAATRANNPGAASLLDSLTSRAETDLAAGNRLTADQTNNLNNSVAGSQSLRGMAYGPAASYANVLASSDFGNQLYNQRGANASNVAGQLQGFYYNPLAQIGSIESTAPMLAGNAFGQGGSYMAPGKMSDFNPESAYAIALAAQKYDASKTKSQEKAQSISNL